MELTDQAIAAAMREGGAARSGELIDGLVPGLRVRFGEEDARWSLITHDLNGGQIRIPIGRWPLIDLAAARGQARRLRQALEAPQAEVDEALTVGQLLDRYDKRRLSQLRKGRVVRRALDAALGSFKDRLANSLTRRDISRAVDAVADRAPIHANRMLAYSKAFFVWCVGRGYIEISPAAGVTKPTREITRERTPSLSELVEIWNAAEGLGYPFGPIVQLLILTACRRDEIGAMRIAELVLVDTKDDAKPPTEGCWTLPATRSKNGRAIRMPLSPLANQILTKAIAARSLDGPFVFSTSGETPVSGWSRAKSRLDKAIDEARVTAKCVESMEAWRLHDLRRSFATLACDQLLIDPAVADRCLNHVGASTTSTVARVYARNEMFEQRRAALIQWAELLVGAIESHRAQHRNSGSSGS